MRVGREACDDPDPRLGRRIGLVDDAERCLAARYQQQSGAHILRLRNLARDAGPDAQPLERISGRVVNGRGEPMKDALVRIEAIFGFAGSDFLGQRTFSTRSDAKGGWTTSIATSSNSCASSSPSMGGRSYAEPARHSGA